MDLESIISNFLLTFPLFVASLLLREIILSLVLSPPNTTQPIVHTILQRSELFGTALMPLSGIFFGGFVFFGWIQQQHIEHRPSLLSLVSGILTNLSLSIAFLITLGLMTSFNGDPTKSSLLAIAMLACQLGMIINISLVVIHLLPFPPFDMYRIIQYFIPLLLTIRATAEGFGTIIAFILFLIPSFRVLCRSLVDNIVFHFSQFASMIFAG
jgi:Zn-dependent protease